MKYQNSVFIIVCFFVVNLSFLQAQNRPLGDWQVYLAWNACKSVADATDKIYAATSSGVFSVDKKSNEVKLFTRLSGLSNSNIGLIRYDKTNNTLFIFYQDGSFDVLDSEGTTFVTDIRRSNLQGAKKANEVFIHNSKAYIGTDYGLTIFDIKEKEIRSNTLTATPVKAITFSNDSIVVATNKGIYGVNMNVNISDWGLWRKHTLGLPANYASKGIAQLTNGKLYADVNSNLMQYNNGKWEDFKTCDYPCSAPPQLTNLSDLHRMSTSVDGSELMLTYSKPFVRKIASNGVAQLFFFSTLYAINEVVFYNSQNLWIADIYAGLAQMKDFNTTTIKIDGPASNEVYKLALDPDNKLWVTAGATDNEYIEKANNGSGISVKDASNNWTLYNGGNSPGLSGITDILDFSFSGTNTYLSTWNQGPIQFDKQNFVPIKNDPTGYFASCAGCNLADLRTLGTATDKSLNTWFTHQYSANPLVVKMPNGTWKSFYVPVNSVNKILIDPNTNYKWLLSRNGVVVYDSGTDLLSASDDRYYNFTSSNSKLPSDVCLSIHLDRDGNMWVGTLKGVVIFRCNGSAIFEGRCTGDKPILNLDNFNDFLLKAEYVNTIASDGGNRKWVGTNNGLFLISADGKTEIAHYTVDNSPMLSNQVLSVVIDKQNSVAYIGTSAGLMSLKISGTFAESNPKQDNVFAYPNPVKPDYTGSVFINGLSQDAEVHITDVAGNLVYHGKSVGGQFTWDRNYYTGTPVSSGIYLLFSSDTNGSKTFHSKIYIVK